jgi:hypothetical protein
MGDLRNASIFILMLNPGLSPGDYFAEQNWPSWREAVVNNLRQEELDEEYPFLGLYPRFAWHPGFGYWNKKFRSIAIEIGEQQSVSYREALGRISRRVAGLELVPYHSKSYGGRSLLRKLPSRNIILRYVHNTLAPKADKGQALIIVIRGAKSWGLHEKKDNQNRQTIFVYQGSEARSASLSLNKSRGGPAIARWLGLQIT